MTAILEHLVSAAIDPAPIDDLDGWWARHEQVRAQFETTADRALAGGFAVDRLGYAFASGYVEAMAALVPAVAGTRAALCATEQGGNRPRHIRTRLDADGDGWRMTGSKSFVTMGTRAERLVVFAAVGVDDAGRHRLATVVVPADRDGVAIEAGAPTPFAPEIPHGAVTFDGVRVAPDERLPGDGFDDYLKPFRTVEDCHVHAAFLGWWVRLARMSGWDPALAERGLALAAAARSLALAPPLGVGTHLALAGLVDEVRRLVDDTDWDALDDQARARWQRDRALLQVAGTARARRRDVARAAFADR